MTHIISNTDSKESIPTAEFAPVTELSIAGTLPKPEPLKRIKKFPVSFRKIISSNDWKHYTHGNKSGFFTYYMPEPIANVTDCFVDTLRTGTGWFNLLNDVYIEIWQTFDGISFYKKFVNTIEAGY